MCLKWDSDYENYGRQKRITRTLKFNLGSLKPIRIVPDGPAWPLGKQFPVPFKNFPDRCHRSTVTKLCLNVTSIVSSADQQTIVSDLVSVVECGSWLNSEKKSINF